MKNDSDFFENTLNASTKYHHKNIFDLMESVNSKQGESYLELIFKLAYPNDNVWN